MIPGALSWMLFNDNDDDVLFAVVPVSTTERSRERGPISHVHVRERIFVARLLLHQQTFLSRAFLHTGHRIMPRACWLITDCILTLWILSQSESRGACTQTIRALACHGPPPLRTLSEYLNFERLTPMSP